MSTIFRPHAWPGSAGVVLWWLIAVSAYAPHLNHPFQYDDGHTLVQNAALLQPDAWRAALTGSTLASAEVPGGHHRPLTFLSYWATIRLAGLSPWAFHAGNLALHLIAIWLVAALVSRLTADARLGWLAAGVMALHPAHSEAVLYASARAGLLAAVFVLGAMWAWVAARDALRSGRGAWGAWAAALVCAGLAMLSKETAAALPLLALAVDLAVFTPRTASRTSRWAPYVLLAALPLVFLLATGRWRPALEAVGSISDIGRYAAVVAAQVQAVGMAIQLFLWPVPLSVDHPLAPWSDPRAWVWAGLACGVVALGVAGLRSRSPRGRVVAAFAGWALAATLPTLLWPLNAPFQEHRSYLMNVGLSALVAFAVIGLIDARRVSLRVVAAAATAILALFVLLIARQGGLWGDPVALWTHAREHAPDSFRSHTNLGLSLAAAGRWEEADAALTSALALEPDFVPALVARGVVAHRRGDRATALQAYQRAAVLRPAYVPALYNLGLVSQETRDLHAAERWYRRALEVNPMHADSLLNLGVLLLTQGRTDEAATALAAARSLTADSPQAHYYSGIAAERQGRIADAAEHYRRSQAIAVVRGLESLAADAQARLSALGQGRAAAH